MKTDPLLLDIPEQFTSNRLLIRAPLPGDGPAINAGVVESINELRPWMPWAQTVPTIDDSEIYTRNSRAKFLLRQDLQLRLFLREGGTFVGSSGLHRINWEVPRFEIGYWVRTSMVGRGYISEAVTAITGFAFNQLKAQRVEIRCDDRNTRSWRVAERCGFELEGVLRNDSRATDGSLSNTRVYSRIASA